MSQNWNALCEALVNRFRRGLDLWIVLTFVTVIGVLLLSLAPTLGESTWWGRFLRELGTAFIIAVVLTILIELTLVRRIAAGSLDTVMHAIIPRDVWGEIREHIVNQGVVRENYQLSMEMDQQPRADGFYASTTTIEYTVESLKDFYTFYIDHALDRHKAGQENGRELPRFLGLKVRDEFFDEAALGKLATNKLILSHRVLFGAVGDKARVTVQLRELVRVPDSFTWWMSVTTREPSFRVSSMPNTVAFEVEACHPRGQELLKERTAGRTWEFHGIMLPGQGFDILTKTKEV